MILNKTIELWYKGELVKQFDITFKGADWYKNKWKKQYGKKYFSEDVEVKIVTEKSEKEQAGKTKKSLPEFGNISKNGYKLKMSSHYSEHNKS